MDPTRSRTRFEELIAALGVPLAALTPQQGLDLMVRLYDEDPTDGYLNGSWGIVNRYGENALGFSFTRRFEPPPGDRRADAPDYLALHFKVGPQDLASDFPGWMACCTGLDGLDAFRSTVQESPAFKLWGGSPAAGVALVCEDVETYIYGLFDCWGNRDPSRPIVSMTEEEWLRSDDVSLMLRWFRQEWRGEEAELDRILHRYCLACCRRIWPLLPQEESRAGVEVAERYAAGLATREEFSLSEWLAEGAALAISHEAEPESLARWCDDVARLAPEELAAMIQSPRPYDDLSPRGLLEHAAYFADLAMCYPSIRPKESIERYRLFLPASLLREIVGNPFRSFPDRHGG